MTARAVATRRAAHQLLDRPVVLDDPIAVPILGPELYVDPVRHNDPRSRIFRAYMVARSRYTEDQLKSAIASGVAQYVVLGAGLDTFAYRNPFPSLRVFEVDFPSTQAFKRKMLLAANIPEPENLAYVPFDLEHHTLAESLSAAGLDTQRAAYFSWLGVVPYLTLSAFRSTLDLVVSMPSGSAITFDYAQSDAELSPGRLRARKALAARVAAAGEPFQLFFGGEQMNAELKSAGFQRFEQVGSAELQARYFAGREDGLGLPEEGFGRLVSAWVG